MRGSWEELSGTNLEPVLSGETQEGSSYPLDPERHLFVRATIVYEGDLSIPTQTLCVAKAFGRGGELLDEHGMTLWGPRTKEELKRLEDQPREILIAVDVGDPDLVDSATVECRPSIHGEGPDQRG